MKPRNARHRLDRLRAARADPRRRPLARPRRRRRAAEDRLEGAEHLARQQPPAHLRPRARQDDRGDVGRPPQVGDVGGRHRGRRLRGARRGQPRDHRRQPRLAGLLGGQELGGRPLRARARRALRHGPRGVPRLALRRRRARALQRAAAERAEDERGGAGLHHQPAVLGAARLVQEAVQQPRRPAQDAVPHLRPRHGDDEDHGRLGGDARRRRGHPRARAGRHRGRGVGHPQPRHPDGLPQRRQELLHARPAPARLLPGGADQQGRSGTRCRRTSRRS